MDQTGMTPPPPAVQVDPPWPDDSHDPPGTAAEESGGRFPVPFTLFDGLGLAAWTIVAQVVVLTPLAALGLPLDGGSLTLVGVAVTQVVTIASVIGWLALRGRLSWRLLGPVRPGVRHVVIGLGVGVLGFVAVRLVVVVAIRLFGPVPAPDQVILRSILQGGVAPVLALLVAVLLAPVLEETVYRGVLFQSARVKLGLLPAIALSSFVFAIVHLDVRQPLFSGALMLLGGGFAWVFHRSGSLLVPIGAHAVYNGITVVAALALA